MFKNYFKVAFRNMRKYKGHLGDLYDNGNPFLAFFHIFENAGSSREVYVDFGTVTTAL
jgi:hypothetical protein